MAAATEAAAAEATAADGRIVALREYRAGTAIDVVRAACRERATRGFDGTAVESAQKAFRPKSRELRANQGDHMSALIHAAGRMLGALILVLTVPCLAADYPAPKEGEWIVRDFRFHTGEQLPELRLHYTTVGNPSGEPIVVLHGTTGSAQSMLTPAFAGELFGPGQPFDATRYYLIIPDAIGHGKSSKPSDGMRAKFPRYNYDDMVDAHHRLLTEHLGVRHVRLVIGNSMGGMETWIWAEKHPEFIDIAVPMASLPTEMSSRNWMMRRLIIDSIKSDPDWMDGNYTRQPRSARFASVFFGIATNGGNFGHFKAAPTHQKADEVLDKRLAAPFSADANDVLYQWDSSRDFNPSAGLEKIQATLLAINSADDERNPVELGILDREVKRVKNGRALTIPAGESTTGHGTTGNARFYKEQLGQLLQTAPRLAK
jgi:homoserine O-acetyltransferase